MGPSWFLKSLLVLALLVLSFSQGLGRRILIQGIESGDYSVQAEEHSGKSRELVEMLDYQDPEPNTNPRTGFVLGPSPHG